MFEIGNSLREARLRQGLEFARVEADIKIRAKYLRALEEEQFDALPGDTYVKGFLRTYAEYLGLDGQLYLDEYNSRFTTVEEPQTTPATARRPARRRVESNFVVVALAGIVAVTVLVVVGLAGIGRDGEPAPDPLGGTRPGTTSVEETTSAAAAPVEKRARKARLLLAASEGPCWVEVRAGSVNGETLYEGTLELGQRQRFVRKRLWVNLGSPANLRVRLNGRVVTDFPTGSSIVLVTAKGVRTLSTA